MTQTSKVSREFSTVKVRKITRNKAMKKKANLFPRQMDVNSSE